ncbi:MAG: D-alanine--D-alanine ligase family protein [Egibacteraceae bacterium]
MTSHIRTRVLVLFGGRSSEHEISCLSARGVLGAIDRERYLVTTVGITRDGRWTLVDGVAPTRAHAMPSVPEDGDTVALVQTRKGHHLVRFHPASASRLTEDVDPEALVIGEDLGPIDVCFPVLHGPYGEDGTVQGLLASIGVPYVGADVASSAIAIDKSAVKRVFSACGLPQTPYLTVRRQAWEDDRAAVLDGIERTLAFPLFTKPARQGSSIGIRKARDRDELAAGIEEAFGYDRVAIVERGLEGIRELECGVLGNAVVEVTRPGEAVHVGPAFYDYEAKYVSPVELRCPADVPADVAQTCMAYAREAYLAIGARGMARVDFFYDERTGEVLVNEINTIPGLTLASMFPPVWAAEGLEFRDLIDRLLDLALEAAQAERRYAP